MPRGTFSGNTRNGETANLDVGRLAACEEVTPNDVCNRYFVVNE